MSEIVTNADNFLPAAYVGVVVAILMWLYVLFAPFLFYDKTEGKK